MEAGVFIGVRLARGDLSLLRRVDFLELVELYLSDSLRGESRDRRLDEPAELDDVGDRVPARDEAGQGTCEVVGRGLAYEGAAAGSGLYDPEKLERPQRFTNRSARDLELLGELPLRWELVAGAEVASFEETLDLFDDALVEAAAADRLNDGQRYTSAVVRWSDQTRQEPTARPGGRQIPGAPRRLAPRMRALIFDLDGTLIDTVYAHVFAWQRALAEAGLAIDGWKIHRRIGMSGELFRELLPERRPLPGAVELLRRLREEKVPHGIATSGRHPEIDSSLVALEVPPNMVVVDRGDVLRAKPEPDLFLKCQELLGVAVADCYVTGDAVWDLLAARRAGMLSVGLLSGGYGWDELTSAGAFRVYRDPADLHRSLDEPGVV